MVNCRCTHLQQCGRRIKTLDAEGGVNIATGKLFILQTLLKMKMQWQTLKSQKTNLQTYQVQQVVLQLNVWRRNKTFTIKETVKGSATLVSATVSSTGTSADDMIAAIRDAGLTNVVAEKTSDNKIKLTHKIGGEIRLTDGNGTPVAIVDLVPQLTMCMRLVLMSSDGFVISNWKPINL